MGVIVVGVDFSKGSEAGLRFGLAQAKLRQATLRAVHAWKIGYTGVPDSRAAIRSRGSNPMTCHEAAVFALEAILAEVVSDEHSKG